LLPRDDYPRKGFIVVDDNEYFIEQGTEGTLISLITKDSTELIHNLTYRPTDSSPNPYGYSYANSNSGMIHEGPLLYDLYQDYIYTINIITGQLHQVIDLKPYGISFFSNFAIYENYFSFSGLNNRSEKVIVRYDRLTNEIYEIPFTGIRLGPNIYAKQPTIDSITYYNIEDKRQEVFPYEFSDISSVSTTSFSNKPALTVKDNNGLTLIQDNEIIFQTDCSIPDSIEILTVHDSTVICANVTSNWIEIIDYEKGFCFPFGYHVFTPNNSYYNDIPPFRNYSIKELGDEYLIFGTTNDWQGDGIHVLYDLEERSYSRLNIPTDILKNKQVERFGNKLYIVTDNHIHYLGYRPELYEINLKTSVVKQVSDYPVEDIYNVVIGEKQNDDILRVYYHTYSGPSLNNLNVQDKELSEIQSFDILENFGIHDNIYTDSWNNDSYFFSTSNSIYAMENDIVTKLLDVGNNSHGTSSYLARDNYIYVLSALDSAHYAIKIDMDDLSYTTQLIPDLDYLYYKRYNTTDKIINLYGSYNDLPGYYDVTTETYHPFEDILSTTSFSTEEISNNSIIIREYSGDSSVWITYNTETQKIYNAKITPDTYPDPYPDDEGGFYCTGWKYDDNASFFHIDEFGKYTELIKDFNYNVFYSGNKFDGEVKSLAFDGEDSMYIFSAYKGNHSFKSIPDGDLAYWQTGAYYWHESDDRSFLEVPDREFLSTDITYTFTFDTDPVIIKQSNEERLIMVLDNSEKTILAYKNMEDEIIFYDFNEDNLELKETIKFQSTRTQSHEDKYISIGDNRFLVLLNDGVHGLEPWIYNTLNDQLTLLKDMNEISTSSRPNDFMKAPNGDIYFSALTKGKDRQLFKLDMTTETVDIIDQDPPNFMILYPSPATDIIKVIGDYRTMQIYDSNGRLLHSNYDYQNEEDIDISGLSDGVYIIQTQSKEGHKKQSKFIKSKL